MEKHVCLPIPKASSDVEIIVDEKLGKSPPASITTAEDVEAVEEKSENTPTVMATNKETTVSIVSHPAITTMSKPVETTKDKRIEKETAVKPSPILLKNAFETRSREELMQAMIKLYDSKAPEKVGEEKDDDK